MGTIARQEIFNGVVTDVLIETSVIQQFFTKKGKLFVIFLDAVVPALGGVTVAVEVSDDQTNWTGAAAAPAVYAVGEEGVLSIELTEADRLWPYMRLAIAGDPQNAAINLRVNSFTGADLV